MGCHPSSSKAMISTKARKCSADCSDNIKEMPAVNSLVILSSYYFVKQTIKTNFHRPDPISKELTISQLQPVWIPPITLSAKNNYEPASKQAERVTPYRHRKAACRSFHHQLSPTTIQGDRNLAASPYSTHQIGSLKRMPFTPVDNSKADLSPWINALNKANKSQMAPVLSHNSSLKTSNASDMNDSRKMRIHLFDDRLPSIHKPSVDIYRIAVNDGYDVECSKISEKDQFEREGFEGGSKQSSPRSGTVKSLHPKRMLSCVKEDGFTPGNVDLNRSECYEGKQDYIDHCRKFGGQLQKTSKYRKLNILHELKKSTDANSQLTPISPNDTQKVPSKVVVNRKPENALSNNSAPESIKSKVTKKNTKSSFFFNSSQAIRMPIDKSGSIEMPSRPRSIHEQSDKSLAENSRVQLKREPSTSNLLQPMVNEAEERISVRTEKHLKKGSTIEVCQFLPLSRNLRSSIGMTPSKTKDLTDSFKRRVSMRIPVGKGHDIIKIVKKNKIQAI